MLPSEVEFEETRHSQPVSPNNTSRAASSRDAQRQPQETTPWSSQRIAILAALWIVGAGLLTWLSFAANANPELPGDAAISKWIQQLHQPVLVRVINFASDINWPYPAGAIAITILVIFVVLRHFRAAICAALAAFGADLANLILNSVVARQRPNNTQIPGVSHLGMHSYPSGHVTHACAFYGFLLFLSIRTSRTHPTWRPWLVLIQVICGYMMVFVGPARVLESEHWPSDVLAGYLLGGLVLILAIALYDWLTLRWQNRQAKLADPGGRS